MTHDVSCSFAQFCLLPLIQSVLFAAPDSMSFPAGKCSAHVHQPRPFLCSKPYCPAPRADRRRSAPVDVPEEQDKPVARLPGLVAHVCPANGDRDVVAGGGGAGQWSKNKCICMKS